MLSGGLFFAFHPKKVGRKEAKMSIISQLNPFAGLRKNLGKAMDTVFGPDEVDIKHGLGSPQMSRDGLLAKLFHAPNPA